MSQKLHMETGSLNINSVTSLDPVEKESHLAINKSKDLDVKSRRTVKFLASNNQLQLTKSNSINSDQRVKFHSIAIEANDTNTSSQLPKSRKMRSLSPGSNISSLNKFRKMKELNSSFTDFPNKREYIIRSRERITSDQDYIKNNDIINLRFEFMRSENMKAFGEDGMTRFDFGSNKYPNKKELLRKKKSLGLIVEESKPPTEQPKANKPSTALSMLKAITSPRKEGLYRKLAVSFSQTSQTKSTLVSFGTQPQTADSLFHSPKELESPLELVSQPSTSIYNGVRVHTRTSTLNDSKGSISILALNTSPRNKLATSNRAKECLSPKLVVSPERTRNQNQSMGGSFHEGTERRVNTSQLRKRVAGAELSLQMKKNLADVLKMKRIRTASSPIRGKNLSQSFAAGIIRVKGYDRIRECSP